jgi:hypothetical protein
MEIEFGENARKKAAAIMHGPISLARGAAGLFLFFVEAALVKAAASFPAWYKINRPNGACSMQRCETNGCNRASALDVYNQNGGPS